MKFVRYDDSQLKGYKGHSRYEVSPEEVARARIGFLAGGGSEFLNILPITQSMTEGSFSPTDTAEAVLVGNIALLRQVAIGGEARTISGDETLVVERILSTVMSGIKALEDGAIAEAQSSNVG